MVEYYVTTFLHYCRVILLDLEFDVGKQSDKFLQKKKIKIKNKIDLNIPVRIVSNAISTFVESSADVSINETPFFSKIKLLF
jgi:hypothetical protein